MPRIVAAELSALSTRPSLTLIERDGRVGQRRRLLLAWPDELRLAVLPLRDDRLDDAGAVGIELHRADHRVLQVGGRERVADRWAVDLARAVDRVGQDLHE